jgi:hypothetical protein
LLIFDVSFKVSVHQADPLQPSKINNHQSAINPTLENLPQWQLRLVHNDFSCSFAVHRMGAPGRPCIVAGRAAGFLVRENRSLPSGRIF